MMRPDAPTPWRKTLRAESKGIRRTSVASARLLAEADRRADDAVAEGLDQFANGWRADEVLAVLEDAAVIVADLREQAVAS